MLLTNETLPLLLPVQFFSTGDKRMQCLVSMR
ncbi:unnamed protein product, partial [Rotaria sordida]